ncbi:hypothetical protein [[Clostridium] fimetarium]|uniref:Prenyltransferase and squalene oxidase repeat-containing protein n=1 Tax=[Clostridium] fimetarium TaxID=99656 RepID=A0A1I0RSF7_9FIRM|nr:hypothetical protein [[Clostridium] fimetarium]SEW44151.1 hypothetical protein SAMN05421659_1228 [[Clostridium] fimetarium]
MNKIDLKHVNNWMHRNARELDLKIWDCLFADGAAVAVADAMLAYQNEDGGFGHGLDPDNWNANSVPYASLYAIEALEMVGFYDMNHPVYQGIRKYLNATGPEQWIFTLPTNADYPHASFYNYDDQYNKVESTGVIMSLSAFVIKYASDLSVFDTVMQQLDSYIARFQENNLGDMGPSSYITLIDAIEKMGIKGYDYAKLQQRLITIVNQTMQKEEKQWGNYGYRPSDFIKTKNSMFRKGNEEIVEKECDFLIKTLPTNNVWPVSWRWFNNAKLYPKEETISLHMAKARKCIEKMLFLKEFNRI